MGVSRGGCTLRYTVGMSCCPGPERGKPFDPDAELPCEADMARFGDEEDTSTDLFDHELAELQGRATSGSASQAGNAMVAKVVIGAMVVVAMAGVLWMAR